MKVDGVIVRDAEHASQLVHGIEGTSVTVGTKETYYTSKETYYTSNETYYIPKETYYSFTPQANRNHILAGNHSWQHSRIKL